MVFSKGTINIPEAKLAAFQKLPSPKTKKRRFNAKESFNTKV